MTSTARRRHGFQLLVKVLRNREALKALTLSDWDALLPAAEHARLSGRLAADAEHLGPADGLPDWTRDRLVSARIRGNEFQRMIRWEIDRIHRALLPVGIQPVFLKGAGYFAAGLPCAVGRVASDVDILVPEAALPLAESAFHEHGWTFIDQTSYDERYYRLWMHELPPMRHRQRGTMLDVHHTIIPRTSRVRLDSAVLLNRAVKLGGTHVLCPTHMVLHAAVHLFYDGAASIRDLADLDSLLRHYATAQADFWLTLLADARQLGLERPLFYALRYTHRMLDTPLPSDLWTKLDSATPVWPVVRLMDALVDRTLGLPVDSGAAASAFALYLRAHWLRMPPAMLARHLLRKAFTR